MRRGPVLSLTIALALAGSGAAGQVVRVTATVPAATPTGSGLRNLAFGSVALNGGVQTVDVPAAIAAGPGAGQNSGEFGSAVAGAAGILVRITPPATLVSTSNGSLTMPVSFSGITHGAFCWQQGATTCASTLTGFDPAVTPDVRICRTFHTNGTCKQNSVWGAGAMAHIYLGGRITVAAAQPASTYAGTITMTLLATY